MKIFKITTVVLLIMFTLCFVACGMGSQNEEPKEMCSMCNSKETTKGMVGSTFSDNNVHRVCDDCFDSWSRQNGAIDGGRFDFG